MPKQIIYIFLTILLSQVLNAQTKTFNGTIDNVIGKGVPGMTITVNTPTGESTVTDENGDYHLTTNNFPTSVNDVKMNMGKLEIFPNPTNNNAMVKVPSLEGTLKAYNLQGQLLDKATLPNDLDLFINANIAIVRYTNKENNMISTKKVVTDGSATLTVEEDVFLKGATIDTFNYKLRIQGNVNGNEIDLTVNSNGFYKDQTTHTENYTIDTKQTFLQGKTIIIGKIADARNYNLNNPEYVNSRKEGNLTFMLTNADGTFYEQITSDEQGNFTQEVPAKGKYFYMIESGKTHEALIQIIADSIINNEIIGAMTTDASRADNMQLHMGYSNIDGGEIEAPTAGNPKTVNWKTKYLEEGGMDHAFIDKVYDYKVNQFTEEVTQLMKDTVHNTRTLLDQYTNNFFANGNKKWESDASGFAKDQRTTTYWYSGKLSVGKIGRTIKNNTLVSASIGFNKDYFGNNRNSTILALLQEQLSVKTMGELLYPENPSILDGNGGSELDYINNHAITSVEWYQVRSEELAKDGDETKGFYGWDMDQRALEAAPNNQHIQDFVNQNGSAEAIEKMQEYMSGEKSASLPENRYELTETFIDGTSKTSYFTKDNHKKLLEEMNIASFEKEGIESMFK